MKETPTLDYKNIQKSITSANSNPLFDLSKLSTNTATPNSLFDISKITSSITPESGSSLLGNLSKNFNNFIGTDLGKKLAGSASQIAEVGLNALGVKKAEVTNGFDKALSVGSKVAGLVPGVGTAVNLALQGVNLLNQYGGKTANKGQTFDQANTGYSNYSYIAQNAGKKYSLSDTIKG